jgi:hypothetical protein
MDEHEWLTNDDPAALLAYLAGKVSERKLRLWACACCRLAVVGGTQDGWSVFWEDGEALADGLEPPHHSETWLTNPVAEIIQTITTFRPHLMDYAFESALARCVFGNPFRPVAIDPAWRTPTVVALAQAAYEERSLPSGVLDRDRLLILADALEEAGADVVLLEHLRSAGPHVRGCFVVDTVLGRE